MLLDGVITGLCLGLLGPAITSTVNEVTQPSSDAQVFLSLGFQFGSLTSEFLLSCELPGPALHQSDLNVALTGTERRTA